MTEPTSGPTHSKPAPPGPGEAGATEAAGRESETAGDTTAGASDADANASAGASGADASDAGAAAPPASEEPGDEAPAPPDMAQRVLEALAERPLTGIELAAALDCVEPALIDHRQGHLYPLLFEMRRAGRIEARWVDEAAGRVRRYGLPGAVWPEPADAPPARAARLPSARLREFAEAATDRLEFVPHLAAEARAELLGHAVALSVTHEAEGLPRDDADAAAVRAMGDPWKISSDLSRTARGLPTVIFPRTLGESIRSLAIYDAGILIAIVAAVIFVRAQVVAAYHIPTKSMEPTLHGDREGGDRILVFSLAPPPERFDIEVFEGWATDRKQYVKRCVGLPGEKVRLLEGDLWIDDRLVRKSGDALDAMLFPVFALPAELAAAASDGRTVADLMRDRWTWGGGTTWTWSPDGAGEAAVDEGADAAELRWREPFRDALYDPSTGETEESGFTDVADGRITADVRPASAVSRVVLRWARGGERHEAVLCGDEPGVALLVDGAEVARDRTVRLPLGETTRVQFSSVDQVLRLEVDGRLVLQHDLPEPTNPRRTAPAADVSILVTRGRAAITPVRLERDVHWTGEYEGAERPPLGPDEYFMLGDNSSNSQDSRARGAVHRSRLVGRPLIIVWPPRRFGVPR